ncbi:hypothetical protein NJNGDCLN_02722 [Mannheimia haemolytica]
MSQNLKNITYEVEYLLVGALLNPVLTRKLGTY